MVYHNQSNSNLIHDLSKIILHFLLITFFIPIITSNYVFTTFNFVKTLELENGNLLLCTEIGIFINEAVTGQINQIEEATFQNSISKEDFDFVTISQYKEDDKFIIILYKSSIYVLTSGGNFYTNGTIYFNPQGSYYNLVPYNIVTISESLREYYFLIENIFYLKMLIIPMYQLSEVFLAR